MAQTYFINADIGGTWGFGNGLVTADPGAEVTTATGWTVAKTAAGNYSLISSGTERAASSFGATAMPSAAPDTGVVGDSLETPTALTGTFAAGIWTASFNVIAVTSGGDQDGNMRYRLWKSSDGSAYTELTSGAIVCSTVTNLTTSTAQTSSGSTASIGPFTFTNEVLFLQIAWQITGAGGATTRDVLLRKGTNVTLVAPTFTAGGSTVTPPPPHVISQRAVHRSYNW